MQIENQLQQALQKALANIYNHTPPLESISLQPTRATFQGTHTFVTFPLSKHLGLSPTTIGQELGSWLEKNIPFINSYQVVKGFLNLGLTDATWLKALTHTQANSNKPPTATGKKVVIEFSSPNTNKPLHLGHLRNNFLGHAMAQIMKAIGHNVYKVDLVNNRGIHICKSMIAYQKWGKGATPSSTGIKGDHFVGKYYVLFEQEYQKEVSELTIRLGHKEKAIKEAPLLQAAQHMLTQWEAGNKEVIALWRKMNNWVYQGFKATYKQIGIHFDKTYYESDTYLIGKDMVLEGLKKSIFYQKEDSSIWVDLEEQKLDKKLLLRSNGTSVYITQDMGTIQQRYEQYNFDNHIYVVGSEQNYHFKVLFEIEKKLQKPYAEKLSHLSYGMVDLPTGKMKSREGTTVDADNLIGEMVATAKQQTQELGKIQGLSTEQAEKLYHTLGLGALKYFLLKVSPHKRILFDPQSSIDFQGHTGPFIQYTHARIQTMLNKAKNYGYTWSTLSTQNSPLHPVEKDVIVQLVRYPALLQEAANTYTPAIIAQYAYDLAKSYNRLYATLPIANEKDDSMRTRRLYLSSTTVQSLKKSMTLLGIVLPDKM